MIEHPQDAAGVAPRARIYLLGALAVHSERGLIHFTARKTASLFAYLALHPEPHAREKLAALLWADSTDSDARHSLRSALSALRKQLGADLLRVDRETVQLDSAYGIWVDAREFSQVASETSIPKLEFLVTLYQGDLLSDFYDDWILIEREQYRTMVLDALLRLARRMRAQGEPTRALEYARKLLAAERANEQTYQELMLGYAALGDRAEALRQYDECVRILRQELDVEPSAETKSIYAWLKSRRKAMIPFQRLVTNLPRPLSSFIGREKEIRALKELVVATRLVTLTGTGGSGKTRLAIQVAAELLDATGSARRDDSPGEDDSPSRLYKDGVWWVELAGLIDSTLIAQAVANVLGVRETSYQSLQETLVDYLGEKELLLALDNCEHLIEACAHLAHNLLTHCPNFHLLATSREPLSITGETLYQVPTLSLPAAATLARTDELLGYESVRLFVERARAVKSDFALTQENAAVVVQICERLDGIPLAIEMAAARTKLLTVEHIAERLDDRFALLTAGSRTALPRQQTLRAAMDWSHDLLPPDSQKLFRRLAVFAPSFSLEAAEAICADEKLARRAVLDHLARLVDRSLVGVSQQRAEPRYRMLETVRQYAHDKLILSASEGLSEAGEFAELRARHLDFFLTLAEQAEPHLTSAERKSWLDLLELEHDNLRAALEWSQSESVDSQDGLRLASALFEFWKHQGYFSEGRSWLEKCLARAGPNSPLLLSATTVVNRAKGLYALGNLSHAQGEDVLARNLLDSSLALWRQIDPPDPRGLGNTLVAIGISAREAGNPVAARALTEEALALFRASEILPELALALAQLGLSARDQDDYIHARKWMEESEAIYRELGDEWGVARSQHYLGLVALRSGDYATGFHYFETALELRRRLGQVSEIPYTILDLGLVALNQGDEPRAQLYFQESEALFRQVGNKFGITTLFYYFGYLAMSKGDVTAAESYFKQSLMLAREIGPTHLKGSALLGLAGVAAMRGQLERAARLWGAAEAQTAAGSSYWDAADRRFFELTIAKAREGLGDAAFEAAYAQGHALTFDQASAEALN